MIRIGVLSPHAANGPEAEFPGMAPGRVVTCVARVSSDAAAVGVGATPTTLSGLRMLTAPPFLDGVADMLGRCSVDVIGYASTSSAYAAIARPVLTSNQVLLWNLLAQAGATFEVSGYSRLFLHKPPVADTGPVTR